MFFSETFEDAPDARRGQCVNSVPRRTSGAHAHNRAGPHMSRPGGEPAQCVHRAVVGSRGAGVVTCVPAGGDVASSVRFPGEVSFHILNTGLAVCAAAGPAATTCHDVWCDNGRCTPGVVSHDVACTGKLCCCVFAAAGPSATIVTAVFWGVLYHPREPTALQYEDVSPRPLASALTHRQTTSSVRRTAHDTSLLKQEPRPPASPLHALACGPKRVASASGPKRPGPC